VTIPDGRGAALEEDESGNADRGADLRSATECRNAFCTKHVSRVARGAQEDYRYPPAVRFKEGGHLGRCLSYLGGSARGDWVVGRPVATRRQT
jgi:hypothetical protein